MNKYYSQYNQDEYLDQVIFKKTRKKFFIDIGANDGITYSNTYFFEKEREWTGICFEPIPSTFEKLIKNRKCECINAAVSDKDGEEQFIMVEGYAEMLSGLKKDYAKEHYKRLESEIESYGGNKVEVTVKTFNLNDFCKKNNILKVDYLSIDTEGSEYLILRTINFKKIDVKVLSIEANYRWAKYRIKAFMFFTFQFTYKGMIGGDMIFVNKSLK